MRWWKTRYPMTDFHFTLIGHDTGTAIDYQIRANNREQAEWEAIEYVTARHGEPFSIVRTPTEIGGREAGPE